MTKPLSSHQLVNQTSGDTEIYTPPKIVEPWRAVLGEIDLDPASSLAANKSIRAKQIYTEPAYSIVYDQADGLPTRHYHDWGGLEHDWYGKVVLNPPFGTPEKACKSECTKKKCTKRGWHTGTDLPGMNHWVDHFVGEYERKHMIEGMMICFAATSEKWFKPLLDYPQCFPDGRTNYLLPDGTVYKGVTKGSCITYLGKNVDKFAAVFGKLGTIKVRYVPSI